MWQILALNKTTTHKSRAPNLTFQHSPTLPDQAPFSPTLPHVCCYTTTNRDSLLRSEPALRAGLGYAEFFIEVKSDPSADFFVDPPSTANAEERASHNFLARPDDAERSARLRRAFSKHISHVSEIFARQQRVFLFSISMAGSCARLCRWDRCGVVVTESFDIRQQPNILCEFLWRFATTSVVGRGHDITVQIGRAHV